ncbi:MAG: phytanoyl-CoA dioxygenase family protein [Omnitrophica WOR_2 bacterium]
MAGTLVSRLNSEQISYYRNEGYLIYREPVFSAESFAELKACFEDILADLPEGFSPEMMDVPHYIFPELYKWLFADEVLSLVSPFLGEDIALFSSHFISKPGGVGKRVPWHEDSSYWRGWMDPMDVVTVWLAIDPSTRENGCMMVIPRTQGNGYSDYEPVDPTLNVFNTEIVKPQRDESKAVAIELQPNQASLHDGRLQHGSNANTSAMRRTGYTMRYISTRTRLNQEKIGSFQKIFLARGRDYAGNEYGDPAVRYEDLARTRTKRMKSGH